MTIIFFIFSVLVIMQAKPCQNFLKYESYKVCTEIIKPCQKMTGPLALGIGNQQILPFGHIEVWKIDDFRNQHTDKQ